MKYVARLSTQERQLFVLNDDWKHIYSMSEKYGESYVYYKSQILLINECT